MAAKSKASPVAPRGSLAALLGIVVGVSLLHYFTPTSSHAEHAIYRWFFHLPIILAAFWFGLPGGVGMAAVVTVLDLPHVLIQWGGGMPEQWLEIALYNIVGWVTGILSRRLWRERDRYRVAAEELDGAYAELKERAKVLVETEEQLRSADRLAALGQLSAGLAHEVKTPLASIRGASEILAGSEDPAEREEFAGILTKEVDRLNRVVNRFLDFARTRTKDEETADLAEAVTEVLTLVRLEAERRGVEVRTAIAPALPPAAVDPEQLRQVLLNLVMNALQAMDSGGILEVAAAPDGTAIALTVADTGPGIPPEIRGKVFDPFYTTRERGTGLGLSIVRKILMNHGAAIEVIDGGGGGTVMAVRLPAREAARG